MFWNYAYIASSVDDSFQVLDISDPTNPTLVAELTNGTWWSELNWIRAVKVIWNYAYMVSSVSDSFTIIDISNPLSPTHINSIVDWGTNELDWAYWLYIDWNYAYISAQTDDWIQIINITDPTNPFIENQITDVWTLELNWADTLYKVWNTLYVWAKVDDGLEILDIAFDNTSPYIQSNTYNYSWNLSWFSESLGSWNQWDISYQISKNNWTTWYYLNWWIWTTTTWSVTQSSTASEINSQISAFDSLAWWTNQFLWKAFLTSDWNQEVEIDSISVTDIEPGPWWTASWLQIWLRSDIWTSTTISWNNLNTWNDQSWNWYNATAWVAPTYLNSTTENLNFNPIVDFNWTNQYMQNLWNWAYTHSYFAVIIPDETVNWSLSWQVPFWIDCNSWVLSSWTCWLTFAWLTLWAFTLAINDEVITHAIWSSTRWRSAQIWTASYPAWKPMLINMNENITWDGTEISEKWLILDNYNANTYQTVSAADYRIWMSSDTWNPFEYNWKIAEIINFDWRVNSNDKIKIESYLSLKYWLTLDSWNQDYIASDWTTNMWSTALAWSYNNNIFGIGRDDASSLSQIKSKSLNNEWVITIEAIWEWTNLTPSFNDIDNYEFLSISDNAWSNVWTSIDTPAWYYILNRYWKVQEVWELWNVSLDFDVANTNFDIPDLSVWTSYYFLYDSDNDWLLWDETPQSMINTTWNIWQVNSINLNNWRLFSLATLASSNNIPTDILISSNNIDENSTIWSTVWSFSSIDSDTWDSHTYSLALWTWDDDNWAFSIIWNNLTIIESSDYEIKNTYSIRVQTDDWNGWQFQKQISIYVNNIWEAVSSIIDFETPWKYTVTSWTWTRTTTNPNEWSYSLESTSWWANTQTCFEVSNTFTTLWTITFDYNVSSESWSDFLRFYLDNVEQQSWSWTIPWATYSKNDVSIWSHTYKWCYIKDWTWTSWTDQAFIDYITLNSSIADSINPIISWVNYASGTLLPWWNHDIIISYSDWESWINTSTDLISLYKWDWVSSWWADISTSWFDLASKNITVSQATYPTDNLTSWKYRLDFQISDNTSNPSSISSVFYIDIPEFIISTPEVDIGNSPNSTDTFSSDLTITVKTIWAGFDVILNQWVDLTYWWLQIQDWNWTNGFWFDNQPYTSTINLINTDEIITTQIWTINTDWNQYTYIYNIKLWINPEEEQAAWDYEWNINFRIDFNY